ncbi:MAG: D-glycero-beta-D-manno-heptose 1,7-bisphosphate 7-phosphatase [Epsilonproteobacteria bacterium]|nr:D-glycero-beta-D-manno-heptose-1,7-bisphosphate 7-phosphatase [Campylobacterota bacterium]NPA56437.1 D-glycero-beta-D-manno-heptose 1,7-bisphosphate 7-phosphatase [Campylobacterota bacterium]
MKAVFLDRDGVINRDLGYVHRIEDFHFIEGIFEALRYLQDLGYTLFIVTNQSGIGRGYYGIEEFEELTEFMLRRLKEEGIEIKKVYFCPHHPDQGCNCRKPEPGMVLKAAEEFGIDLKRSWLIGDKESDIEAAQRAGVGRTILLNGETLWERIGEIKE